MADKISLKGGALIIGSLLWQNYLENGDNVRADWRVKHLTGESKLVKVPIRYGKYSKDDIITMVFSDYCQKANRYGTGYVFNFARKQFKSGSDIVREALDLATAEGFKGKLITSWGSVGILFNPSLSKSIQNQIVTTLHHSCHVTDGWKDYRIEKERSIFEKHLVMRIKWPIPIPYSKKVDEIDFLLATATNPNHNNPRKKYPTIEDLAKSVRNDKTRLYFLKNIKHGVSTFQDRKILNIL